MGLSDYVKITNSPSHPNEGNLLPKNTSSPMKSASAAPGMSSKQIIGLVLLLAGLALVGGAILMW